MRNEQNQKEGPANVRMLHSFVGGSRRPDIQGRATPVDATEARQLIACVLADDAHFRWLKERLLHLPDAGEVAFDPRDPIGSYAAFFSRLSNPCGAEAGKLHKAMAELKRDVQVVPGLNARKKRWKVLCLAVSAPWLDPHLEQPFPDLQQGLSQLEELVGPRGNHCTDVQIVTFTEWNGHVPWHNARLGARIEALGALLKGAGVRLQVFTWDARGYGWSPELNAAWQPLMTGLEKPCRWRVDTWGPAPR